MNLDRVGIPEMCIAVYIGRRVYRPPNLCVHRTVPYGARKREMWKERKKRGNQRERVGGAVV